MTLMMTHRRAASGGDLLDLALVSRQMASRVQYCDILYLDIGSVRPSVGLNLTLASPEYSITVSE